MHDFESAEQMDADLVTEELCIGRIPNVTQKFGYTHHIALVYKSTEGEVMSLTMAQHSGELKPGTLESMKEDKKEAQRKEPLPRFEKKFRKKKQKRRRNREQ